MRKIYPLIAFVTLAAASLACSFGLRPTVGTPPTPVVQTLLQTAAPTAPASPAAASPLQNATADASLPAAVLPGHSMNLSDLYDQVNPGVVLITVDTAQGVGLGSGFVYDKQGHIITNDHVISGATDIEVDFPDGFKSLGKVVGEDTDSDIAVVKLDNSPENELHPLSLGDSSKLRVGQSVVAIGNPYGYSGSMTSGIVSALGRTLDSLRQTPEGTAYTAADLIQTDAAINPGNSGGPLLTTDGLVVGINRAIESNNLLPNGQASNSGVGFAVSINIVKRVVPVLISQGKYDYPYLGLSARPQLSLADQAALGLSQSTGGYIMAIVSGGPADRAGLRAGTRPTSIQGLYAGGDLIIAVDGHPVIVFGDLVSYYLNSKSPGDKITLTILRDNQKKEVVLTLGKRP